MSAHFTEYGLDSVHHILRQRKTLLLEHHHILQDRLSGIIYSKFKQCGNTIDTRHKYADCDFPNGSVFNVEFTPQSNTVIAVHSEKSITLHDTRTERKFSTISRAHDNSCNIVTFVDEHMFVTGSDDKTVKLWDTRYCTKGSLATLKGHKGWVKNVEFDHSKGLLFSLAFNDGIRKWDMSRLESYQSSDCDNLIFDIKDAVRMRLAPDGSKMIISARKDHLYIITKFDGETISSIYNAYPQRLPIKNEAQLKLYSTNDHNVPIVHVVGPLELNRYRTPICFVFHPSSEFIAMRLIDVKMQSLLEEITVLYRLPEQATKPIYSSRDTESNFLKYVTEQSPEESLDYIKEINFSNDGRVLASPFKNSVRLLAVDVCITAMDEFFDTRFHSFEKSLNSVDFEEIAICDGHKYPVLTCKLNSDSMCLVSGCMEGRVVFNWPKL